MDKTQIRDVELRFVIRTEMTDAELDKYVEDHKQDFEETLIGGESLLCSLYTDKISYDSKQLIKELGVE